MLAKILKLLDMTLTKVYKGCNDIFYIAKERYNVTDRDRGRRPLFRLCNDKFLFVGTQPMNVGWEVGNKEVDTNTDDDCRYTFEYEYPSPTAIATNTLHVSDGAGK